MASDNERDSGSLRITVKDVYQAVNAVSASVNEIKGQLNALSQDHTATKAGAEDHEERLRKLEQWRYAIPTSFVLAAMAAASSIVLATIKGMSL